jgi:hypothetical protein
MTRRSTFLLAALTTTAGLFSMAAAPRAGIDPVVTESDAAMIQNSAQDSLEFGKNLETTKWVNPDTENSGTITPTETYETDSGEYCREYHQTVTIGGVEQEAYGTACRAEDGSWEIVRDEPDASNTAGGERGTPGGGVVVESDEPPTVIYRDRVVYVPERRPLYGYPVLYPFALSLGIGHHDGYYGYYGGHRHPYYRYPYGYRSGGHRHYGHGHRRGLTVRRGSYYRGYNHRR